jgi:hypothetical protein
VSRSTVATEDAGDFLKARFQAELMRVTDPRSNKIAQSARSFTDSSTDSFAAKAAKISPSAPRFPVSASDGEKVAAGRMRCLGRAERGPGLRRAEAASSAQAG